MRMTKQDATLRAESVCSAMPNWMVRDIRDDGTVLFQIDCNKKAVCIEFTPEHWGAFDAVMNLRYPAQIDVHDFLYLAKRFSDLGDSVGKQLIALAAGERVEDLNPKALMMCHMLLKQLDGFGIDGAVDLQSEIYDAAFDARTTK